MGTLALELALEMNIAGPFERAMEHCDNLVTVHQRAGSGGRGRRRIETSVNRAVVVIAIASWQAVVQDMTKFALEINMPAPTDPHRGMALLIRGQVLNSLKVFSTPNAENTQRLLRSAGFDPRPHWTWDEGQPGRTVTLKPHDVSERLGSWLKVRHAIAHGEEELPAVDVLQCVQQNDPPRDGGPSIRLHDARKCIKFIRKLTGVTLAGLRTDLSMTAT